MDECSGKTAVNGLLLPRRGLRDTADNRDENVQFCSRQGCSSRLNYTKSRLVGSTEKPRPFRPSFSSSNGKEVVGSSSRTSFGMANTRKSLKELHRKSFSQVENDLSETSSVHSGPDVSEHMQSSKEHQPRFDSAVRDIGSSKATLTEVGSSSRASSSRTRRIFSPKSSSNQNSLVSSSVSSPAKAIGAETRRTASGAVYVMRNLKCNSASDVLPQSCSSSESRLNRRDMVKRRNLEGESSSSSKGKKMSGVLPKEGHTSRPTHGISISDSRSYRSLDFREDNRALSVRTRRSMNVTSCRGPVKDSLQTESSGLTQNSHSPQPESPNLILQSPSQFFTDASSIDSSVYSIPGNDVEDLPIVVPCTSTELGMNQLMNRDVLHRYNMDGIAQVLVALERIEQDEELTYEQLLVLESNLFLGGLNLYDQHRDMRLDIDNMSYEELLALEERIGTVSTALSEESLSKCLQKTIYQSIPSEIGAFGCNGNEDEIKCSICQEEYMIGDEIGRLGCEHGYHVECIQHWLRLKNWCPICKASAAPEQASTSTS